MISYLSIETAKDYWVKVGGADCHLPYYVFCWFQLRLEVDFIRKGASRPPLKQETSGSPVDSFFTMLTPTYK